MAEAVADAKAQGGGGEGTEEAHHGPRDATDGHAVRRPSRLQHKRRSRKSLSSNSFYERMTQAQLINLVKEKDAQITALELQCNRLHDELQSSERIVRREHPLVAVQHVIGDKGRAQQKRIAGRHTSVTTSNFLGQVEIPTKTESDALAERTMRVFTEPTKHMEYLSSMQFATDIVQLCEAVADFFEEEARCLFLQSPVYIFGDIHGNLEDLHFFCDNIWKLGVPLTAGRFLFLGDYVDRGLSGLEVVAYLFSLKILYPEKIFLLRGNHETRDVNGWEEHYGDRSFLYQCRARFGDDTGLHVWEEVNQVFDRLPLAGIVDHDIFCVHGGIPRPVGDKTSVQGIMDCPSVLGLSPPYEHESEEDSQIGSDCIWSDPAMNEQEDELDETGFGESVRGGGAVCFGNRAIEQFLSNNNLSYIVRAHEAHAQGVSISKGARVFTVFSTSKDHGQGSKALAGCILVDFDKIQVINRSPAYKNKFVHRRQSTSLVGLTQEELVERFRLGLIVDEEQEYDDDDDDEDDDDEDDGEEDLAGEQIYRSADADITSHVPGF